MNLVNIGLNIMFYIAVIVILLVAIFFLWVFSCGRSNKKEYEIKGTVDNGFEPAKDKLKEYFETNFGDRSQLCVYVADKCVIDLYGAPKDDQKYNADSMTTIFSNGKKISSILAIMVD